MKDRATTAESLRRALAGNPADGISWHNLAAAEGDLGRAAEAEVAARRAISLGVNSPETRLVLARALQSQRRFAEAQRTYEEAIALRPGYAEAHRDLAQLVWMRTADAAASLERLSVCLESEPGNAGLHLVRSIILEFSRDPESALQAANAGLAAAPSDIALLRQASHLSASAGDPELALTIARRAIAALPMSPEVQLSLCEALLACGRPDEVEPIARALHVAFPTNQHALAVLALAWRMRGDASYREIFDYSSLVEARYLDVVAKSPGFLANLARDLHSLHQYEAHPLQQSVRGGSQLTLDKAERSRPLVRELLASIKRAATLYLARLGTGTDPMRSRNSGTFEISGAWSVRLRSGGHHADHVHQKGWLSAVCYVEVPPGIGSGQGTPADRSGWLRLGQPGIATRPVLPAESYAKPEPGLVVLFPAYMWHGVEPFADDAPRLSVALDIVPA